MLSAILFAVILAPIWSVERFFVHDGSGHINTSYVMTELIKGNAFFTDFYTFNSPFVPNSGGHWLMALLLQLFSPFVVTKIMMSLTFAVVPTAVVWFRWQAAGSEGLTTSLLIGCSIGFNWLWMVGSYNFILGFAGFVFTLGLFCRWRDEMNFARFCAITLLLAFVFVSHLIGFFLLAGSIAFLAVFAEPESRKRTIVWTFLALLATLPLLFLYQSLIGVGGGEPFSPVWRGLADPYSLRGWINHFIGVDPFILISRRTLPFTKFDTSMLAVFAPILWIVAALALLTFGTIFGGRGRELLSRRYLPFVILFTASILVAFLGPDDFKVNNGGLLRERIFMAALVFTVPLFQLEKAVWARRIANCCLIFVLIFQTAAMWEYSLRSNEETKDLTEASKFISDRQTIASVVVMVEPPRFHSVPVSQMTSYLGIGKDVIVLDNYEMGHYLFPVVTRDPEAKRFVYDLIRSNFIELNNPREDFNENLAGLDTCLAENSGKIDIMLLWGRNEQVENILKKSFDDHPFFESGRIRLFHRLK